MEEKKIIYQIFMDCWDMVKRFFFLAEFTDAEWDALIEEGNTKSEQYRKCDNATWHLYRDIFTAIVKYKETKEKEKNKKWK